MQKENSKANKKESLKDDEDWKSKVQKPEPDLRPMTEDVTNRKGLEWDSFKLRKELHMGILAKGFDFPSPVQEEVIPNVLESKNVIARAKNGTGKTAAFVIPMLNMIDEKKDKIQALILVPTRELALQTSSVIKDLAKYMPDLQVMVSTGGTNLRDDIMRLQKPIHVMVGTPGRILDLAGRKIANLSECKIFVLDEADKLVSEDFQPIILKFLQHLPKAPQFILMSATFPTFFGNFLSKIPDLTKINLMKELTLKGLTQYYAYIEEKQKVHCLNTLFSKLKIQQAIIFCNTSLRVELLAKKIIELGYSCYYIYAKMGQTERNKVFHGFRKGNGRCLVTSDLFTRGIDVPSVNVVVNFDFPKSAETYLHRVGRSGRYGHLGLGINFITDNDKESLLKIEEELNTEIAPLPKDIDTNLY